MEEITRAVEGARRAALPELSLALWRAHAAGAIGDDDAQRVAELIAARKAVPTTGPTPRRTGSRPRSPASMERRRRWTASGWLPPGIAARFTLAEVAVLSVVAGEVARRGLCRLTIGHVAALAGVCRSTVKNAIREARSLGLITVEEWRLSAWRSAPNTIRIVAPEWRSWLRMRDRRRVSAHPRDAEVAGGVKAFTPTYTHIYKRPMDGGSEDRRPARKRSVEEDRRPSASEAGRRRPALPIRA